MVTKAITVATILTAVLAAPSNMAKRDCQTQYLPTLWTIHNGPAADMTFPSHADQVLITREPGPFKGFTDTLMEFDGIPAGAQNCQFKLNYNPGNQGYFRNELGDASEINVYAINNSIPENVSWNEAAAVTGDMVGSFLFPQGEGVNLTSSILIETQDCQPTMRFRLAVNNQSLGYAQLYDNSAAGFAVAHDC